MFWYQGSIDLKQYGHYAIFKIISDMPQKYNEKFFVLQYSDSNSFDISNLLDDHRRIINGSELEATTTAEIKLGTIEVYNSLDEAITQCLRMGYRKNLDNENPENILTNISKYIARFIHLSDHRL